MNPSEWTTEETALASVLAPADRKLRFGSQHPLYPSQPNTLAHKIARSLLAGGVVQVKAEGMA